MPMPRSDGGKERRRRIAICPKQSRDEHCGIVKGFIMESV